MSKFVDYIVDTNFIDSDEVVSFLSGSKGNRIVICDYVFMEIYLGDVRRVASRLEDFSSQMVLLKNTSIVAKMKLEGKGLRSRLQVKSGQNKFRDFCKELKESNSERGIQDKRTLALQHMERMHESAGGMLLGVSEFEKTFTPSELKLIRRGGVIEEGLLDKFVHHLILFTFALVDEHPEKMPYPKFEEWTNSFLFRNALTVYMYIIEKISTGDTLRQNQAKVKNDMVDMIIAAYALYFDGVLSKDRRLLSAYESSRLFLASNFG